MQKNRALKWRDKAWIVWGAVGELESRLGLLDPVLGLRHKMVHFDLQLALIMQRLGQS